MLCTRSSGEVNGLFRIAFIALMLASCAPADSDRGATPQATPDLPKNVLLAEPDPSMESISLVRVLATPQAVDGKAVSVGGYLHLEFEASLLCLHKEDVDHLLLENCIWIDVPKSSEVEALSDHYVTAQGKVNARAKGHMGMYQATLQEVSRLFVADRPLPVPPTPPPAR